MGDCSILSREKSVSSALPLSSLSYVLLDRLEEVLRLEYVGSGFACADNGVEHSEEGLWPKDCPKRARRQACLFCVDRSFLHSKGGSRPSTMSTVRVGFVGLSSSRGTKAEID